MAEQGKTIDDVPSFTSPKERPAGSDDTQRFKFDGDTYTLRRPKMTIAMTMLRLAEGEDSRTVEELGLDLVRLLSGMIAYIVEEKPGPAGEIRGRARLMNRLMDPDDPLDLMDLNEPFQQLIQLVFKRPTKPPPASSRSRPSTRNGSGAGSRPKLEKTSGT